MAWVLPTGFEDPGGGWQNEELAFDNDVATNAKLPPITTGEWTSYLVLTFPHVMSGEVRAYLQMPGSSFRYEIDVYDGQAWTNVAAVGPASGPDWFSHTFAKQAVTKVRIRLRHYGAYWSGGGVSECLLEWSCSGPLVDICGGFYTIGSFFADLANRIDDIMFVGDALAAPFRSLAGTFHDLGDTCCEVSATLQDILDALEGGLTAEEILVLLQEHWPALAALLDDPVAYITEIVSPLIPELPDWLDDPVAYITEIVLGILPDLPDWLTDPVAWLAAMFEENFPLLYYLIVDPGGWLLYIVGEAFGLEPYEAQDWDFVLKALFERYFPELYLLWRELTLWAGLFEREGAVGVLTELKERFYGLAERALRFLWEGEWRTS